MAEREEFEPSWADYGDHCTRDRGGSMDRKPPQNITMTLENVTSWYFDCNVLRIKA